MQREETVADNDLEKIVEAIFVEGNPVVYEAYSAFDSDIVSFLNALELYSHISKSRHTNEKTLLFVVHYPDSKGFVEKKKIGLNRQKCDGHTYRYSMMGWGLIQFQVDFKKTPEVICHFAVNTEK